MYATEILWDSLLYDINQLVELNAWDSKARPISVFGTMEFLEINSKNIPKLKDFGEAA